MAVTKKGHQVTSAPPVLGLVAGVGSAAALLATYWDDSWHTDKGRDEFAIPPHVLLYGGVLLSSLAVAAWGVLAWRRAGWGIRGMRVVLAEPALLLAGLGGVTTLVSGPIDAAWHEAYGRDSVLWSPPHLTAVLGTLGLSVGLLAGLRKVPGMAARVARLLAAAGVIGTLQVPVLEYDSDVPQFSALWFLPVAALGLCVAVAVLDDLLPETWEATRVAVVYTVLRAVTVGFLAATGFSLTVVPPVALLFAGDALLRRRPLALRLVVLGAAAPLVWWPFLWLQAEVTTLVPASLLPASVALGAAAGVVVAIAHGDLRPSSMTSTRTAALVVTLGLVLLPMPHVRPAWAHDPGQGEQVREGQLALTRSGERASVRMALDSSCEGLVAVGTTARRAEETLRGPLRLGEDGGDCRLEGTVEGLGEGRWFVYVEVQDRQGRSLEAWLPAAPGETTTASRPLYATPAEADTGTRNAAAAVLLGVAAALVVACLRLSRRSARVR